MTHGGSGALALCAFTSACPLRAGYLLSIISKRVTRSRLSRRSGLL